MLRTISLFSLIFSCFLTAASPNVIVIMTDDLGYGDIYCLHQYKRDNGAGAGGIAGDGLINGDEEAFIYTPQLDRMAAEGAKLTRHYTSAPVCAPARGSLLQGRDQGHANIRNNSFDKVISDNHTLGTVMKQAGYYTACLGKWGVGGTTPTASGRPNARGFDYFYGYIRHSHGHQHYPGNGGTVVEQTSPVTSGLSNAYTTDLWTAKAKQIIQDRTSNNPDTPFFIYLAYDAPHAQLQVPTQAYPTGLGVNAGLSWPLNTNSGTNDSWIHPDYNGLSNAAARHATMVRRIDTCVGDILQTLRDLDIADNTLVVFTSDNGTHNESGSGGSVKHDPRNFDSYGELEGIKRDHLEGGIRMPTFAWWPGSIGDNDQNSPAQESTRPSAFWDWMPTLTDAAGITPPAWSNGSSLLPELTQSGTQFDQGYLYFEYSFGGSTPNWSDFTNHGGDSRGQMQTIFMDGSDGTRYKGIRTGIGSHSDNFRIYDIDNDHEEGVNLAAQHTDLQQKMKDQVLRARIDGDYSRSYMSSEYAAPLTASATVNGLNYKVFTGSWPWVPETGYLTPDAEGECSKLDLSVRTQESDILLEFTGFINLPSDGTYTFSMSADTTVTDNSSGAMLWIHDAHIIDDDFNHDGSSQSGSMRLKAGLHPIRVLYKHASGDHNLQLQYSGPGISLQPVPDSSLFREGTPDPKPQAQNDTASTNSTTAINIPVLDNDLDDGLPSNLSIISVSQPAMGATSIDDKNIIYTPTAGKYGHDEFNYTVTDGEYTATATVTVQIHVDSNNPWFPLNESSGNTVAEAGGLVVGTHSGFSNSEQSHIVGRHGYALRFDGLDDQVELTNLNLPVADSARTVSAWIRVSATSGVENQVILSYGQNSNGERFSFRLIGSSTQVLRLEVQGGSINGTSRLNDGNWHHVAVVVDDFDNNGSTNVNEAKLYVDGQLEPIGSTSSEAIDTASSNTAVIGGASHSTGYNFTGDIDEIRINHSAKSAADISLEFNAANPTSDAWLYQQFADSAPAWNDDSDKDGITLLAEYAFGQNPHLKGNTAELAKIHRNESSQKLEITYTRRKAGTHTLNYSVEISNDLKTWTIPSTELSAIPHPELGSDFEQVVIESQSPISSTSQQFIRIKAE